VRNDIDRIVSVGTGFDSVSELRLVLSTALTDGHRGDQPACR
jgi:hypothetical protein